MISTLILLMHSENWGSIWRTGRTLGMPGVRALLGVGEREELLGWLYVGTDGGSSRSGRRRVAALSQGKVARLGHIRPQQILHP
jgi:hypothetical protein